MAGGSKAVQTGTTLREEVIALATNLGLECRREVQVGRRIWGARNRGTADEKIPATILDIAAWPIPGLVVFAGEGISANIRAYLHSTGKAVAFEDLESWMRLFFGIP
jgi:hypothetical protein